MDNARMQVSINGEVRDVLFAPYKSLLEILREDLGLAGTKHGCELGADGARPSIIGALMGDPTKASRVGRVLRNDGQFLARSHGSAW